MKLYVLGSGTCIPTVERGPSGLALALGSHLIFFDGGGGSLRQMVKLGLDYRQVDFLCLTHFHPDHVSDFVPFLFAMNYTVDFIRLLPLHIIGPSGLENFYSQVRETFGQWIASKTYRLYLHEATEDRLDFSDFAIETLPMLHSDPSIGFRVEAEGKSIVYSGDTDYCENIVRLGKNADLLILECSFPDERKSHRPSDSLPWQAGSPGKPPVKNFCSLTFIRYFRDMIFSRKARKNFPVKSSWRRTE